jgi:hypothetical protein
MDNLTFPKAEILKALKKNRDEHLSIVKEAQTGYRTELKKLLLSKLTDLEGGKPVDPNIRMTVPESHVDDYDRAIMMLEMSKDTELTLDQSEFQCYVRDKWQWERNFLMSNSNYSPGATRKLSNG